MGEELNQEVFETEEKMNPWFSIWTEPRKTMRHILNKEFSYKAVLLLSAISGIAQFLDGAVSKNAGEIFNFVQIFALAIIAGALFGIASLFINSAILKLAGKIMDGKASYKDLMRVVAWSNIPLIWSMLLWIPELMIFGKGMFMEEVPKIVEAPYLAIFLLIFGLIEIVVGIWNFVIYLNAIGEAQGFSFWYSFLNVLLAGFLAFFIIIVPIILISLIFIPVFIR